MRVGCGSCWGGGCSRVRCWVEVDSVEEVVYLAVGLVFLGYCVRYLASMFGDREVYVALVVFGRFLAVVGLAMLSTVFLKGLPVNVFG